MNLVQIKRDVFLFFLKIFNHILSLLWRRRTLSPSHPSNPLGLAAGFDKDGKYLFVFEFLRFGFVEVGTILRRPQKPNPGKIIDRGKDCLWNYMGFPSAGLEKVKTNLEHYRKRGGALFVIASLGPNRDISDPKQIEQDILESLQGLENLVDGFSINFASPNTQNLRDKMQSGWFESLLKTIKQQTQKPCWLKLHPDLSEEEITNIVQMAKPHVDGIIFSNTTKQRPSPYQSFPNHGGLSGAILLEQNLVLIPKIRKLLGAEKSLIGCGGVMHLRDIVRYQEAGANLVQVYSGLALHPLQLIFSTRKLRKDRI